MEILPGLFRKLPWNSAKNVYIITFQRDRILKKSNILLNSCDVSSRNLLKFLQKSLGISHGNPSKIITLISSIFFQKFISNSSCEYPLNLFGKSLWESSRKISWIILIHLKFSGNPSETIIKKIYCSTTGSFVQIHGILKEIPLGLFRKSLWNSSSSPVDILSHISRGFIWKSYLWKSLLNFLVNFSEILPNIPKKL